MKRIAQRGRLGLERRVQRSRERILKRGGKIGAQTGIALKRERYEAVGQLCVARLVIGDALERGARARIGRMRERGAREQRGLGLADAALDEGGARRRAQGRGRLNTVEVERGRPDTWPS